MGDANHLNRRDLFKLSAVAAGTSLLQPSLVGLVANDRQGGIIMPSAAAPQGNSDSSISMKPFPTDLQTQRLSRPNIVLIVLDTVRADHLSCYGYYRDTTPNIDAFAANGLLYKNTMSPGNFTLPGHASLFTGLSAGCHGANWLHRYLDDQFETLATRLAAGGYQTVGLACNNGLVTPASGLARGFQTFWNPAEYKANAAVDMHNHLVDWFDRDYDAAKPFFLFMNYIEAHDPYDPPRKMLQFASEGMVSRWRSQPQAMLMHDYVIAGADSLASKDIRELECLYDDAIRYVDGKVGEVLAFLKASGLDEDSLVIITADHGEHLGEHRMMQHSCSVYEPLVRVPLIVWYPGRLSSGVEERLVQSHDVYPTILEAAGLEWKREPGQSCQSLLYPDSGPRYAFCEHMTLEPAQLNRVCEAYLKADCQRCAQQLWAVRRDSMKLICSSFGDRELYDVAEDPLETRNVIKEHPEVAQELAGAIEQWWQSNPRFVGVAGNGNNRPYSRSTQETEAMRGLGYIQ